jgi:hypothetical protein
LGFLDAGFIDRDVGENGLSWALLLEYRVLVACFRLVEKIAKGKYAHIVIGFAGQRLKPHDRNKSGRISQSEVLLEL